MSTTPTNSTPRWLLPLLFGIVVVLSFLTFFWRYQQPPYVYWDENYHIASAQKYLHGVYFMEQHPPLGKLLVALGEKLIQPNYQTDQFLGTDYGTQFGDNFSFAGYRFFSALLAWLTAPVLFGIFYFTTKRNPLYACLLSFLYIFDNALIVHTRGAMLEGPLLFFSSLTILAAILLMREHTWKWLPWLSLLFGVAFALTTTTKVLGLIFLLFIPVIVYLLWPNRQKILTFAGVAGLSFVAVYCTVWYVHFSLGRTINPALPDQGYYQASDEYKEILETNRQGSLLAFPVMLRDSWKFVSHYNNGAPRLDLCKRDENGSPFFFWPFGGRTINYRWETPEGKEYRYLTLVPNPVVWYTGLAGVALGILLLVASYLTPLQHQLKQRFLLSVFVVLYICYMIAVSRIDRVMYLYHYFLPLLMSFIIFGIVFQEIQTIGRRTITEHGRTTFLLVLASAIFLSFQFYRPFTYYTPLTNREVEARNLFPLWELSCATCERDSSLVIPSK